MNTLVFSKIKNIVLFIIVSICFYNCKEDDCNGDCNGFDFATPIYDWYLFPSNPLELKFVNNQSDILTLNQIYTEKTEPRLIERSCFSLFTSSDCNEFVLAGYESDNGDIDIENTVSEEDDSSGFYFSLIFNSNIIGASFENNQFTTDDNINDYSFNIFETVIINDKIWEEVLVIRINENYRVDGLSEIWIQKNKGLIAFKINDITWIKDIQF
jgi:hypothetical protein